MEADGTRYLEAALSSEAKDAQDHCDRGRVYYYMEDYSNAKKELLEATKKDNTEALLLLGMVYLAQDDVENAQAMYKQYISAVGDSARAIMVWHCAISEAEIMIPLLITSQKVFRQLPQTRCRVFCSMRS